MRVLSVKLENETYECLARLAAGLGREPEALAATLLEERILDRAHAPAGRPEVTRTRYVQTRLKMVDPAAVARELDVPPETLDAWDRELRSDAAAWSTCFVAASRSVDPLSWEMTVRERFYTLWGHRPKAGG